MNKTIKQSNFSAILASCLVLLSLAFSACKSDGTTQAPDLEIVWRLDRNVTGEKGRSSHAATFWLINRGSEPLGDKGWALHWNQSPRFVTATEGPAAVKNINGDFYSMTPRPGFSLAPGDTAKVTYTSNDWLIKVADGPLGLYVAYGKGGEDQTASISKYKVLPFENPDQYTRSPSDKEPYPDAAFLYQQNERLSQLPNGQAYPFLPAPKTWTAGKGTFNLPNGCRISVSPDLEGEGKFLASEMKKRFGLDASVDKAGGSKGQIALFLVPAVSNKEGYQLEVNAAGGVVIKGGSSAGVFYGVQSLLSLARKEANGQVQVPACNVADQPAFGYRGLHIDVSRNFQSKQTIMRLLDLMGRYKLNRLLFNITEDEGWRLDIKGLPELVEVGSRRGHLHRDSLCLQPSYGSGPDPNDPKSHGNGYYTREEFKEIIRYAHERHISVIPEINLPGHSRAAIKAMELRYDRLMAAGKKEEAQQYRLIDPADTSRYISAQGYFDNTACVCQPQPLRFFETAVDDIIAMYQEAKVPLLMFHTGGDEVPATAWTGSPLCKEFLKGHPEIKNTRNLQGLFFGQMVEALRKRGLLIGAWEEAVMVFEDDGSWHPNPNFAAGQQVYPYIWNNLWGNQDLGYKIANGGYPVVLCNVTNFYFDLAYNKDPREPGLYWGGFVDVEDAWGFIPYNLFESTRHDNMGRPLGDKDFAGMQRLSPANYQNVAGLSAQLWGETIKGQDMLEYYYLPKLFGLAQRAWQGQPAWSGKGEPARNADFNRFMNTAAKVELPFLEQYQGGYNYRIPSPGILVADGQVRMNTAYPGFQIRYTTDGSEPTASSPLYEGPFPSSGGVLKAACFNASGRSGLATGYVSEDK